MKKIYSLILLAVLKTTGAFSQVTGITSYPVSIPSTTVHITNLTKVSTFVIDNNNNKWIGFNYGNANSFQLLRFNGAQWDTFPAFNAINPLNKVNALAVDVA